MVLVAALLLPIGAAAQTVVVDGDTIKLNGTTYRLWGIDAPETKQWCGGYPAGIIATGALRGLMRDKTVTCEPRGTDPYGRTIGLCRANGEDLSEAMVKIGLAWAFTRYSRDYVEVEAQARAANLGRGAAVSITRRLKWRRVRRLSLRPR